MAQQEYMMQFFNPTDVKPENQDIAREFLHIALFMEENTPRNPERTIAFRKLLSARDSAIRARKANTEVLDAKR